MHTETLTHIRVAFQSASKLNNCRSHTHTQTGNHSGRLCDAPFNVGVDVDVDVAALV